ncbi:exoglucanase B-like [Argopecten irradians]|uniref:exoglucanase B-like n=1 Tax=Argopecten irradians TaxID=31199 RepID=UPI00371098B1
MSYELTVNQNLIPGTTFQFHVYTYNAGLTSTGHADITGSTVPDVPKITRTSTTTDSITVQLVPSSGGVDEYFARADCRGADIITPVTTVSGNTLTISGLAPATTCNLTAFTVYAGLNSSVAYFTGLSISESEPGQVGGLVVQSLSSTAISVTWNKPTQANGDIIQYSVYVTNPVGTCVQHVQLCSGICVHV